MSETDYRLDDKYTEGVWYDTMAGDFSKIREVDDTIGLFEPDVEPEDSDPYYTFDEEGMTKEDAIDTINADMSRVSDEAVENPVAVVTRALDRAARNDPSELMSVSYQEAIDLRYALTVTEIVEQD
jgi:hypothetical protein